MPAQLYDLMRRVFCAWPMTLISETVRPGMLLRAVWAERVQDGPEKFIAEIDSAWRLMDEVAGTVYQSELLRESIIVGGFSDELRADANLALPQFGFRAGASFDQETTVKFTVGSVKVRCFKNPFAKYDLRRKLRGLKETDRRRYLWANNGFLVSDAYYAADLRIEFDNAGGPAPKSTYAKMGIAGGFAASWADDMTLILAGTAHVPFAVAGLKI